MEKNVTFLYFLISLMMFPRSQPPSALAPQAALLPGKVASDS